jgi:hypothetical protein
MTGDGVSVVAQVVVASFVIDRVVSGVLFLGLLAHIVPDPEATDDASQRIRADRLYKLVYFILAAALVVAVLIFFPSIQVLKAMGITEIAEQLDRFVTGLLLIGGAERLSQFLQPASGGKKSELSPEQLAPPPLKVEGTLILVSTPEETARIRSTRDFGIPSS